MLEKMFEKSSRGWCVSNWRKWKFLGDWYEEWLWICNILYFTCALGCVLHRSGMCMCTRAPGDLCSFRTQGRLLGLMSWLLGFFEWVSSIWMLMINFCFTSPVLLFWSLKGVVNKIVAPITLCSFIQILRLGSSSKVWRRFQV